MKIFKTPAFCALILVHFGNNFGHFTLLFEIPTYLNNIQHFSLTAVSIESSKTLCKFISVFTLHKLDNSHEVSCPC